MPIGLQIKMLYWIFLLFNASPISWVSRKQKTVATSATEAEYMSLSDASKQICWTTTLLKELAISIPPVILCGDNMGSIFLVQNPAQECHTKHIDIRYHFICEWIQERKVLELHHVPTDKQLADVLTKSLGKTKFSRFWDFLVIDLTRDQSCVFTRALVMWSESRTSHVVTRDPGILVRWLRLYPISDVGWLICLMHGQLAIPYLLSSSSRRFCAVYGRYLSVVPVMEAQGLSHLPWSVCSPDV